MRNIEIVEQELSEEMEKLKALKSEHELIERTKTKGTNCLNLFQVASSAHHFVNVEMLTQSGMESMAFSSIARDIKKCKKRIKALEEELAELQMN